MQDLAIIITGMLIVMLVSSLASLILGWRAHERRARIAAIVAGIPGGLLGASFAVSLNTAAGIVIGAIGLMGVISSVYRLSRTPRDLVQD